MSGHSEHHRGAPARLAVLGVTAAVLLLWSATAAAAAQAAVDFWPAEQYPVGKNPTGVVVRDFNGDGILDAATSNYADDSVSVLLGVGGGVLGTATRFAAGDGPKAITAGDFNGDGRLDLAVANEFTDDMSILLGAGNGSFGTAASYAAGDGPQAIANADVDGDGDLDVAVVDEQGGGVTVLRGRGNGTFTGAVFYATASNARGVNFGDFDEDGDKDLAVANEGPPGGVTLLFNDGNGGFGVHVALTAGSRPKHVSTADLNGDGHLDLAVSNEGDILDPAPSTVSVFMGNGAGQFGIPVHYGVGILPKSVHIGDLSGDAVPDLVVVDYGLGGDATNNVAVLVNDGAGGFEPAQYFLPDNGPKWAAIADLDSDGANDLAVSNNDSSDVSVLLAKVDAPSGSMAIDAGATATNSTAATLDSSVTGAIEMRFRDAGGSWTTWESYAAHRAWTLPSGDGTKSVEAEYRNAAGHVLALSDTIVLDTLAPTGTLAIDAGATYAITPGVTLGNGVSGASQMRFRDAGGTWTSWEAFAAARAWTLPGADGTKTVEAEYRDAAGNVLSVSDGIVLDTTAPQGTFALAGGAGVIGDPATSLDSAVSGATQMRFRDAGGAWTTWETYASTRVWTLPGADGTKTVEAEYRDAAGNVLALSDDVELDATGPTGVVLIDAGVTATNSVAVTLTNDVSGATEMRFRDAGVGWTAWEPFVASRAWTLPSGDGVKTVEAEYRDTLGRVLSSSDDIELDTVAPTGAFVIAGDAPYAAAPAVTLDNGVTGAVEMRFRDAGGVWTQWEPLGGTRAWTLPSGDGPKTVEGEFRDAAGNTAAAADDVLLDTLAPVTTSDALDGWYGVSATVGLSAVDPGSGVELTEYRVDGGPWTTGSTFTILVGKRALGDGVHLVEFRSIDAAGNVEQVRTDEVRIDRRPPVTVDDADPTLVSRRPVTVTLTASDQGSGVAAVWYYRFDETTGIGDAAWTVAQNPAQVVVEAPHDGSNDGVTRIYYFAVDNVSLSGPMRSCTVTIDARTKP